MGKQTIIKEEQPDFKKKEDFKDGYEYCAQVELLRQKKVKYLKRCTGVDKKGNPKGCKQITQVSFPNGTIDELPGFRSEAQVDAWYLKKCGCDCVKKDVATSAKLKR